MGTLLMLVFILDLLASATSKIAPCDVAGCLDNFSLTGDNRQFCVGVRKTLQCVGDITYNYNCSTQDRGQVADLYHRLERMSDCVCSQGSTYTCSLQLSVGLAILAHVLTSFK